LEGFGLEAESQIAVRGGKKRKHVRRAKSRRPGEHCTYG
jgi:hypothetical protein